MTTLLSLGGSLGLLGVAYLLVVLGLLSSRLGAVLKMPPMYRWFYLGAALVGLAWLAYLARVSLAADPSQTASLASPAAEAWLLLLYHLPLAAGLTIGLVVAWRYWAWLLNEG
jgi:hypothetical protein